MENSGLTRHESQTDARLKKFFKVLNIVMVGMWRLGLGFLINLWPSGTGQIMVLTHTGRKSGKRRQTPVNFALVNEEIYCTAGFGAECDWYRNVRANPQVEVWLPDSWWAGIAEEVFDPQIRLQTMRKVLIASGFAAYVAGINPHKLSDEELEKVTREYKLVRIRRTTARTGPGGPGEWAWVWPAATFYLLLRLIARPKRRK